MVSRRKWVILGSVAGVLTLTIICIIVAVVVTLEGDFKRTFIRRCERIEGYDCQNLWSLFQQAYVGKDPCNVTMADYNLLFAAAPFKPACNRTMFWSKTEDVVQGFTKKSDCFLSLNKTVLGSALNGLTWCGKKGSSEMFKKPQDCPDNCENNPVSSFWKKASAAFADYACDDVSVVLDGDIETPFDPKSIFGSIELIRFKSPRVRSLKIVLVSQENTVSNCMNPSLQDLQRELDAGIKYNCTEMKESQFIKCCSEKPCVPCW